MTLNVHNVHRWLTHTSAITYGSLSQRCQWLSPVMQTKLTINSILKLGNWFWLLLQLLLRLQHCLQTWSSSGLSLSALGPLIIIDEVKAI